MNPFEPNTVTTSPENEDLPPRPRFIPAVLSCLGLISEDMEATEAVTRAGAGLSSTPLRDRAAILVSETEFTALFIILSQQSHKTLGAEIIKTWNLDCSLCCFTNC